MRRRQFTRLIRPLESHVHPILAAGVCSLAGERLNFVVDPVRELHVLKVGPDSVVNSSRLLEVVQELVVFFNLNSSEDFSIR